MLAEEIWSEPTATDSVKTAVSRLRKALGRDAVLHDGHGYALDAAAAGLDLVTVYARRGETSQVFRVASDLVRLFQSRDIHPEALAAIKAVQEAAERQSVNFQLLAQAADRVRANQVRGNPTH